mmetsp:Transcript_1321/g.1896  ORF Transcript_1321/g.1896 Transcript_1321/m.1896 type:complete len:108 (-) Transcript_1321:1087-1410(-)
MSSQNWWSIINVTFSYFYLIWIHPPYSSLLVAYQNPSFDVGIDAEQARLHTSGEMFSYSHVDPSLPWIDSDPPYAALVTSWEQHVVEHEASSSDNSLLHPLLVPCLP